MKMSLLRFETTVELHQTGTFVRLVIAKRFFILAPFEPIFNYDGLIIGSMGFVIMGSNLDNALTFEGSKKKGRTDLRTAFNRIKAPFRVPLFRSLDRVDFKPIAEVVLLKGLYWRVK